MPTVDVKNWENKTVGTLALRDDVFAVPVKPALLWEAVKHYLASRRRGTHQTKTRGRVKGSGRKPWRQKGTGRARVGSIRSPLWRHGGIVHGPHPRDYGYRLPRKVLLGALRVALTTKFGASKLLVLDQLALETHKAKSLRQALDRLGVDRSLLIVEADSNQNLQRASRNLPGVKRVATHIVHPYDVLAHDRLLFSQAALEKLQSAIAPRGKR
ncbi:MAG: 50S ribosomal protein L4 [Terriglobia bacterium]